MPPRRLPANPRVALAQLRAADPALARAMDLVGPFRLPKRPADLHALCVAIIGQQVSIIAAAAIAGRFTALVGEADETVAERLLSLPEEQIRAVGLSGAKARTVHALARFWQEKGLTSAMLTAMPDEQLIDLLTHVKGIGPWTVKMFLIFSLNRPDVLAEEDLGVRMGLRRLYSLPQLPTPKECHGLTEKWRPFRTVATWYLWQLLKIPSDDTSPAAPASASE